MQAPVDAVRINGHHDVEAVPADRVFFTFGSGRLDYDCGTCGAQCCRGHGYNVTVGHELQAQLISKPALKLFLAESGPTTTGHADRLFAIRNCPPACFHLDEHGRCGLQLSHGYEAKPETCRLFPFNHLRLSDGYLVVAPHQGLCPLSVVSGETPSLLSDHGELLRTMGISGVSAGNLQQAEPTWSDTAKVIQLERQILAAADRYDEHPSYVSYARFQVAATTRMLAPASNSCVDHDVNGYLVTLANVLGACPSESRDSTALLRVAMSLTPTIRSHCVFRRAGSKDLVPEVDALPLMLLALHNLAAFARDAGMLRITYQTILSLFGQFRTLLQLLSWLDSVVVLRTDVRTNLTWPGSSEDHRRYIRILKALVPSRQRQMKEKLGDILAENLSGLDAGRMIQLNRLAERLVRRVAKQERPLKQGKRRRVAVTRVQHWALAMLPEDILQRAGQRQRPDLMDTTPPPARSVLA